MKWFAILAVLLAVTNSASVPEVWNWHDKVLWGASLTLAIAGIFGIWVAICTLKKVERQTKSGEKAANAALLNAQAVMNAERAWITANIHQPSREDMRIREKAENWGLGIGLIFKNLGATPAKVVSSYVLAVMADSIDPDARPIAPKLPLDPDYTVKRGSAVIVGPGVVWMPRQKFDFLCTLPKAFFLEGNLSKWEISEKALCIYGYIEYSDVFKRRHTTRFCFTYLPIRSEWPMVNEASGELFFPAAFCPSGPESYNDAT
ncbi:MAG TPA: hypothetical protein VHX63_16765 [Acidobacteriaceae bacterium]|jgi:hypothetical protein|nr:hypothetical protein [Acidobacteriaceae bacterium]